MTIKGENAPDIDNIDRRIRDMIKENETLKDVVKKQADKIYRLQNSIDKSDSVLVEFMADKRCEIKTLTDENHQTKQNSQNLIEVKQDISEINTVISSLATETGNNSTKIQSVKEDIDALKITEKSVDSRITRLEDSKFSGVDALRANLKLVRKDIYDLNDEIDTIKSDIKVNNRSISDLHKSGDMKKTKTKTKNYPKSPKISTDSDIDLISFVSPKRLSKFQMAELTDKEQAESTTEHQYRGKNNY
ncbi:epidermal growth factor receptor substrate 15-like 1 [Mytilus edulis]|uniref:epidermal growth factor receptor substrate 15-like 1 n=1 Tax=Mytilus edulis TaxID=6550 RepID=UPI0039F1127A